MKKTNYIRPLAEVIELDAQDIITSSTLSDSIGSGEAKYIPAGSISEFNGDPENKRVKLGSE